MNQHNDKGNQGRIVASDQTFVVVGGGHAGGRAAEAMRMAGFDGAITVIGQEPHVPYERPPLSKDLLAGDDGPEGCFLNGAEYYSDNNIDLRLGCTARAIDTGARHVTLEGGGTVPFHKLLLATGGRVRKLQVPGDDLEGVYYLRGIDDSQAIREELKPNRSIAVIGGGFIGLEVAASARDRGCRVTVIELQDVLLGRVVDPEVGQLFAELHRAHGVEVLTGLGVERLEGDGRVSQVVCAGGKTVAADAVVVGIGIIPNAELAADAGIATDNGITVDQYGETSVPGIYAAGDVANHPNPILGYRVRLETWQNAQNQSIAVARNMCGEHTPFAEVPWFWSDQYDVNLQIAGAPLAWDRLVTRGERASGKFMIFYMAGDKVVAANAINLGRDMRFAKKLIEQGRAVSDAELMNEDMKLKDIAA